MHFGQFNLMGYRTPGTATHAIYDAAIAQVKAAEQAGFHMSWFAEHHFSNYGVCPSPLMMIARCAGETTRIKLASGVVIVPLYDPARLLAEIGMVDAMTHGRLVLGIGSGYQPYEFERFGADLTQSAQRVIEFMDMLDMAQTRETFSFKGQHYSMPETHIAPRTLHGMPDVFVAGDNPDLHRLAARRGYAVMVTPRHFTAEMLGKARDRFAGIYREVGADPATMRFAALRHLCVTDSRAEAREFLDHARYQIRLSQSLRRREESIKGAMLIEKPWAGEMSIEEMEQHMLVGSAETIAERMAAEIRRAQPYHYLLHFEAAGSSLAWALRSIEAFATRVRPLLEKEFGPLERIGEPVAAAA